jgi:hypothetical protein
VVQERTEQNHGAAGMIGSFRAARVKNFIATPPGERSADRLG